MLFDNNSITSSFVVKFVVVKVFVVVKEGVVVKVFVVVEGVFIFVLKRELDNVDVELPIFSSLYKSVILG